MRSSKFGKILLPIAFALFTGSIFYSTVLATSQQKLGVLATSECSTIVNNQAQFNAAIDCFNDLEDPGSVQISLSSSILLTSSLNTISNSTTGLILTIDGNELALDGQNIEGISPIRISASSDVIITEMTIKNSRSELGTIYNQGKLKIAISTITQPQILPVQLLTLVP